MIHLSQWFITLCLWLYCSILSWTVVTSTYIPVHVQSVSIVTIVVSLIPAHDKMHSIQIFMISLSVNWSRLCGFSPGTQNSSMNKTGHHNIAEILLKLILSKCNYTRGNWLPWCNWYIVERGGRKKVKFEDTKGVVRSCKWKMDRQYNGQKKDRQYNGQKKKDRQYNGHKIPKE